MKTVLIVFTGIILLVCSDRGRADGSIESESESQTKVVGDSATEHALPLKKSPAIKSPVIKSPVIETAKQQTMNKSHEFLRQFIRSENAALTRFHTDYYQYLMETKRTDGSTLEEHLRDFGTAFSSPNRVSNKELAELESAFKIKLPQDLVQFYRTIGEYNGADSTQSLVCHLHSCRDLLKYSRTKRPYERLSSLGIPHGIRHSWGNSRPELTRGDGISEEQCDRLSDAYTWFGYISDGSGEAGLHFSFNAQQQYCLFYWHQDEAHSDLSPDLICKVSLAELLQSCIEGYLAVRQVETGEEGELPDVSFRLADLVRWLEKKYSK